MWTFQLHMIQSPQFYLGNLTGLLAANASPMFSSLLDDKRTVHSRSNSGYPWSLILQKSYSGACQVGLPRSQRLRTLFLFCKASFSNSLSDSSVVLCQLEGKGQPEVYEQTSQLLGCHCGAQLAPNSALQIIGTEGGGRLMSLVKSFKDRGFLLLFFAFWFFFLA